MRATASAGSTTPSKKRVTSSMPSTKTNERTFENCDEIAYTRCRVKRAKLATEPEMSAITKISGLAGRGWRKRGSTGTPPGGGERRMVGREAGGPLRAGGR